MKGKLLFAILFLLVAFGCKSTKSEANPNKGILGTWYSKDNPKTFIEINDNDYREVIGEMDSELRGTIYWKDSLSFVMKLTNVEGAIGRGENLKIGKTFPFKILYFSLDTLRMNVNNTVLTFSRTL